MGIHIKELFYRINLVMISFFVNICLTFFFAEEIIYFIIKSTFDETFYFIFTEFSEIFSIYMSISLFSTFFLSGLVLLYNFFIFLAPGLYLFEWSFLLLFCIFIVLLLLFCFFLSYKICIPIVCSFFMGFESTFPLKPFNLFLEARLGSFLFLCLIVFLLIFFLFLIPFVVLFFLIRGFITKGSFSFYRKFIFFFCFLSFILFPFDIVIQFLLIFLYYGFFEIGFYLYLIFKNFKLSIITFG